jgi:hypothetical protein
MAADTVLNTTVFDGAKKLITHYNVVSGDGEGSTTKIVDVSGLKNTEASGFTGDVNVVLPACSSGDTGTIVCEWIKVYES